MPGGPGVEYDSSRPINPLLACGSAKGTVAYCRLANPELGFNTSYTVVDIDDFASEGVKLDFQVIESGIQSGFKVTDARFYAAHPGIHPIKAGIQPTVLDGVHQDSNQDGKGRNPDGQIKLQVRHLRTIVLQPAKFSQNLYTF